MKRLVMVWVIGLSCVLYLSTAALAEDATYVGTKQCKICHNTKDMGEIWNTWKSEPHSKALETLGNEESKAVAQKLNLAKPPAEAPECLSCHLTAYDPKTGTQPEKLVKEEAVQCESCHGPASLHLPDAKKYKAGDKSIKMDAHIIAKPDVKTCEKCHNEKSPTWKPDRYTLPDGTKKGFDFTQAWEKVKHGKPK